MILSEQAIERAKTPAGGWTRETLARWGVPWPPPAGWKEKLVKEGRRECFERAWRLGFPAPPADGGILVLNRHQFANEELRSAIEILYPLTDVRELKMLAPGR